MIPKDAAPRAVESWIGGLEELETLDYVRALGHERALFKVTRKGYAIADQLASVSRDSR